MENPPSEVLSTSAAANVKRGCYYLDVVTFQIEDELFKVPRQQFIEQSVVFKDMFDMPQAVGSSLSAQGIVDDNPVVLATIKKAAFIPLLNVLYPLAWVSLETNALFSNNTSVTLTSVVANYGLEEWLSIYELSTMWFMERIREMSIVRVNRFINAVQDPLLKIRYGRMYHRDDWLLDGYARLIGRKEIYEQSAQ